MREVLSGITDDKHKFHKNSTSKFICYHFNSFRLSQGESLLKLRHTKISDNHYALESLQSKNWPYFITTVRPFKKRYIRMINIVKEE